MRQCYQGCPGIARLGGLEAGQGPAQGLFAEAHAGFNGPAVDVSRPSGLGGDDDFSRWVDGRQPGEPHRLRRFVLFQMRLGTEEVAGQAGSVLVASSIPAFQAYLAIVFVVEFLDLVQLAPGLFVFENEALAMRRTSNGSDQLVCASAHHSSSE